MSPSARSANSPTPLGKNLASYLLSLGEGDQLLTSRELAERFGASLGSISATINHLEKIGAVTINRRSRLGSFLEGKSIGTLWRVIENGPMIIALTLPSFLKCEGLATAFYSLLNQAGVQTYLIFIRGSYSRFNALRSGQCHAVVVSALAADELCGRGEEVILRLPPQSFVTDHRVFYRCDQRETTRPLAVGIDYDSFDIQHLTQLEFADSDVVFQPMTITQIDHHLQESSVDAAITNADHLKWLGGGGITSRPLSAKVQALIGDRDTSAALVVNAGANQVKRVLQDILDPGEVLTLQQKVVDGLMVPRY